LGVLSQLCQGKVKRRFLFSYISTGNMLLASYGLRGASPWRLGKRHNEGHDFTQSCSVTVCESALATRSFRT